MPSHYDNWERLVGVTLKREQLRALARADSLDSQSSFSSLQSDLSSYSSLHRDLGSSRSPDVTAFEFTELKNATRKFRFDFHLGKGGFGRVFKGWINENTLTAARPGLGLPIAVKKMTPESFQSHRDQQIISQVMLRNYDNRERLDGVTLKRELPRALACADCLDSQSSFSSIQLDLSSNSPLHRDLGSSRSPDVKAFKFTELKNATRNFRLDSLLGEGSFGRVFKGWIDENTLTAASPGSGLLIAVKEMKPESFQSHREWLAEVKYLGQLQHPNLIKLIGYCCEDSHNWCLVYEFMQKGSLDNHLFRRGSQPLLWATRIKIAIGVARALSFLHDGKEQILHKNFKSWKILLDLEFNAKLSFDFTKEDIAELSFDFTKMGTAYVSPPPRYSYYNSLPEDVVEGVYTEKSDVFNFGVVLLELLSGTRVDKRAVVKENLMDWARLYIGNKKRVSQMMDIKLEGNYPQKGACRAADICLKCLCIEPKGRPRMAEVLAVLEELQPVSQHSKTETKKEGLVWWKS